MKTITLSCDINDMEHEGSVEPIDLDIIFDHDQDDGKSKYEPYFEELTIDMCSSCKKYMLKNKRYVYAYGVMGHNTYYLKDL